MSHRIPDFDALPDSAYIRESHLVRSAKHPDRPVPLQFSAATLHRHVRAGTFPRPVKLSARVTAWIVGEIRAWMRSRAEGATWVAA